MLRKYFVRVNLFWNIQENVFQPKKGESDKKITMIRWVLSSFFTIRCGK